MRINFKIFIAVTAVSAMSLAQASAHMGATGVVKERMDLMMSLGKTVKSLNSIVRGEIDFDSGNVKRAASHLLVQSKKMQTLFPEGSMQPPSGAKPEIWDNMSEFEALAEALGSEAEKLAEIGANGDREALAQQFTRIGAACSGCHKPFRSKMR